MDPLGVPALNNCGAWLQWVIDLGPITATTGTQVADFPFPLEYVRQIYFIGYAASNLSTPRVRLNVEANGYNMLQHVVSFFPRGNTFGTQIPIINYATVAQGQFYEYENPIPLFNENQHPGTISRFRCTLDGWDGASVTANEFIGFFAVVLGPASYPGFNTQQLLTPRDDRYWKGATLFQHRQ